MSKKKSKSFIGIDVSKRLLEVAAYESDYQFRCANKASAFAELIAELIALRPALIVLEATGGLEITVTAALHAAGLPVVVINPRAPDIFNGRFLGFRCAPLQALCPHPLRGLLM